MTSMIVDELGRIAMSPFLTATLTRAAEYATAQAHRQVTLEHLLLALAEDPEASVVLKTSHVDIVRLTAEVSDHLGQAVERAESDEGIPVTVSPDLRRILEAAAAAAQQGRRREINGAIVLAAIVGDGKSTAAHFLRNQGLTFEEAIRALQRANMPPGPARANDAGAPAKSQDGLAPHRERVDPPAGGAAHPPERDAEPARGSDPAQHRERHAAERDQPQPAAPRAEPVAPAPSPQAAPQDAAPRRQPHAPSWAPPPTEHPAQHRPSAAPRMMPSVAPAPVPRQVGASAAPQPAPQPAEPAARHAPAPPAPWPERPGDARRVGPRPHTPPAEGRRSAGTFMGSWPMIEQGQLVENIPRRMRTGIPMLVEARIAKADIKALAEGLQGGGAAFRHDVVVTKAMSMRLRAPAGGFTIENRSPETQWIENVLGLTADEYATWRWTVTARDRGKKQLQLILSARTVGADGLTAETALPDQVIEVKVGINLKETAKRWTGWAAAAVVGGLLARFGESAFAVVRLLF